MTRFWTKERQVELRRLAEVQGLSASQVSERMGAASAVAVIAAASRYKVGWLPKPHRCADVRFPTGDVANLPPPSAAMIALAKFDPVIDRALQTRLGRCVEES